LPNWIIENITIIWHAIVTAVTLLILMIVIVRINGLRSFAKMSSIDFVSTITIGSVISATIMSDSVSLVKGGLITATVLLVQSFVSRMKVLSDSFSDIAENDAMFLMKDGVFLEDNLISTNVTKSDIVAKLREANAIHLDKVHAVVIETTGDISVLHGDQKPDPESLYYEDVIC